MFLFYNTFKSNQIGVIIRMNMYEIIQKFHQIWKVIISLFYFTTLDKKKPRVVNGSARESINLPLVISK